ncbi:2Fe-2S ferredoxin [Haloprofundus marisrubri]|uniref:2Fe-2S ferredoxin n=1 Tax=Haloprofundus marisrubri TaxID=1514971 RepID=A0A0W1R8U0_9EURY|nr:Rieske (2Fe-2S) protein [Haloprofundus marisrubri]KTG09751.1 2Fe-2S ferredoxin [Haloprofundus marisrubri]
MDDDRRITALSEVPTEGTLLFTIRDGTELGEAILTKLDDGTVVAFRNYCQHWTDVRLDKGSGALVRNGDIVCQKHGATFGQETGYCDFGPCEGATLDKVDVEVDDDAVYLADDTFRFEHLGPSGEQDLSSGSRIDFTGT